MVRIIATSALVATLLAAAGAQQQTPGPRPSSGAPQQPARDTPAQPTNALPTPTGRITGRVMASDNGRPAKRARVFIAAAEVQGGRGTLTDDSGVFDFTELPAGRYTVTASKSGFVSLSYGQRRPLQAGTPLQLADGQQLKGIDFQLPRGSVIGGRVLDEDGDSMPGVMIRVMRYQYLQGERRLTPAGTGQTDDKGQYRVWGLMPGDYYVNAVSRGGNGGGPFGGPGAAGGPGGRGGGRGFGGGGGPGAGDADQVNYAPTYYPGVASMNDAKPIAVGLSQEVLDINFGMQLVRMSRVSGRINYPDGTPVTAGNVNLTSDTTLTRGNQIGVNFGGRINWDGAFAINSVPPGRYILRARGDDNETPQFAAQPLSLNGEDVADLTVVVSGGATLTGTITFQGGSSVPDLSQFRVSAPSTDQSAFGPQPNARPDKDGHFTLAGVPSGSHLIRSAGNARGYTLKSVTIGAREMTDTPVEVRAGETVSNITMLFTDQLTEINGTLATESGTPVPDFTVLAFPADPSLWRPQSRQIMTARPDQTGRYKIRGLPPGQYYLATVDPSEQGEWFEPAYLDEHRNGAMRLTLSDGDVKTQDFKVSLK